MPSIWRNNLDFNLMEILKELFCNYYGLKKWFLNVTGRQTLESWVHGSLAKDKVRLQRLTSGPEPEKPVKIQWTERYTLLDSEEKKRANI